MNAKIIQVVMHDLLRDDLTDWLNSRGLELHKQPWANDDPDDLETWFVTPSDALMRERP